MKRKLLFLATFVVSVLGMKADDVFKDVTSTYLTNADFEGDYTVHTYPTNSGSGKRAIYKPTGWTVSSYQSGHVNDMTALDANSLRWNNEFNGKTPSYTGHDLGGKTYWIRYNSGSGQILRLSQETSSALPKSKYRLTVDWYVSNTSTGSGYIRIDDNQSVKPETGWATTSKDFTSTGKKYTFTLGAFHGNTSNAERIYAFDNFKLEWNLTQSLADLIDEANTFYDDHSSYSILKTAIDAADDAKESPDADVLETQYNALSSALALAQAQASWQEVHDVLAGKDLTVLPTAAANAITEELAKAVPTTTADAVNEAKDALQALIDSYDGIKTAYAKVKALITLATNEKIYSAGIKTTIENAINTATTNIETRDTATALEGDYTTLENARQTYVTSGAEPADGHPFDITFKINNPGFEANGTSSDKLIPTGWSIPTTGEKYGTKAKGSISNAKGSYVFNNWVSWWDALNVQQTVNDLPKGRYEVTAILAGYNGVATKLEAGGGTTWKNTTGENNGIRFSVIGNVTGTSLTIKAETVGKEGGSLLIADDFTLSFIGNKPVLQDLIAKATTLSTSNVGTGVFQIPSSAAEALTTAIATAQDVYDDDDAYGDAITNAIDDLNTAIDNFKATALNPPASDKHYNIVVATSGHARVGNAVVVSLGTTSDNNPTGYTFNASAAPAAHLAQAVAFTSANDAEHPNRYYITFEGPNGTLYLTNGTQNSSAAGWSDSQIQGTTDATKKLGFDIVATTTDNVFNIINTATNSSIACQTGDNVGNLYTESGNADFTLVEASQVSATLKITDAKWGTFIVPFTVDIPDGVTAYTATSDGTSITLSDPITDSFAANTPYIVYSESTQNETFTGWGTATQDPYTFGQLTGTYTRIFAPENSYILQKNDDKVGFYLCDVAETYVVAKNRCYLTTSAGNGVKAFILGDFADDIQTILSGNNDETKSDIYDLTGRKVNKVTKGIYIINGKKVMMK